MAMAPETLPPAVEPPLSAGSAGAQDPLDAATPGDPGQADPVDPLSTAELTAPPEPLDAGAPATGRPEPTPSTLEEVAADPDPDPIVIEPNPVTPEPDETRPGDSPGPAGRGT
jgi:hypothetical protein